MMRRSLAFALLALLIALALPAVAAAQVASPASLAEYRARVVEARDLVAVALPKIGDRAVAGEVVSKLVVLLPAAERVQLGDRVVIADESLLRALIVKLDATQHAETRREMGRAISAQLASLEAALPVPGASVPTDPAALKALVAAQAPSGNTLLDTLDAWVNRIVETIRRWLSRTGAAPGSSVGVDVVWAILLAGLVGLALWAGWRILVTWRRSVAARDRGLADTAGSVPVVAAEADLPADALAYAEGLARQGRLREAVRALFGGAARRLADAGLLTRTRTRTNAELLEEVGETSAALPPLRALTDRFETAWYGHVEPDEHGFAEARTRYREVVRAADSAANADGTANAPAAVPLDKPASGGERR